MKMSIDILPPKQIRLLTVQLSGLSMSCMILILGRMQEW